jgi:hypothetical protein
MRLLQLRISDCGLKDLSVVRGPLSVVSQQLSAISHKLEVSLIVSFRKIGCDANAQYSSERAQWIAESGWL